MTAPCGCICAPRQSLADCPLGFVAVGPGATSANPWPGSVVCSAFADYAPTRWKHNDFGYLFHPVVSGGPLITDSWQSDTVTFGGRTWYDVLTISGKEPGDVTLDRHYIGHPDPLFPSVVTYRNVRHLDEFNGLIPAAGNPRNLAKIYILRLQLGDPLAAGFEEDYLPYASWIGDIPCSVTIRTATPEETTPICGSDYTLVTLSMEYDYTLTGPYTTFTSSGGTPSSPVAATPTFSETRHVSLSANVPFLNGSSQRYGIDVPIWAPEGNVLSTSAAGVEDLYFDTATAMTASESGFSPSTHPFFFPSGSNWMVDQYQANHPVTGNVGLRIVLSRTTGNVICSMSGAGYALGSQSVSVVGRTVTLTSPQSYPWHSTVQSRNYPDTDYVYATLNYWGSLSGSVRPGGSYRCQITNCVIRMDGAS